MELLEAMERRHSVRSYEDRPLEPEVRAELTGFLAQCSRESGLHMQLVLDEPEAFGGLMAHYGKFSGVRTTSPWWAKSRPSWMSSAATTGKRWS